MEYQKFDCHDLAEQNTELFSLYNKLCSLSDELDNIAGSLDPQIKSYPDLHKQFAESKTGIADIAARIYASYSALDKIIDVYYSAEKKALQEAETLPAGIPSANRVNYPGSFPMSSTSTINNSDLVLESWLAEMIIRQNNDASKG